MRYLTKFLLVVLVASFFGCGSGGGNTNNDQGVSFLSFGFFTTFGDSSSEEVPDGDLGVVLPLGGFTSSRNDEGEVEISASDSDSASFYRTIIGLQNNLTTQGIIGQRVFFSYEVVGSNLVIPDESFAISSLMGPSGGDAAQGEDTGGSSSLPDGFSNLGARSYTEILVLPPTVIAWLVANKASLPAFPFTLEATVTVRGVTTSGDVFTTNALTYPMIIVDNLGGSINGGASGGANP